MGMESSDGVDDKVVFNYLNGITIGYVGNQSTL